MLKGDWESEIIVHSVNKLNSLISVCTYRRRMTRPNKKISVLRITRPYLNLPEKPIIFFRFSGNWKNTILYILKGNMPLKIHKIVFFPQKKKIFKKKMCAVTLPKKKKKKKKFFFF